MEDVGTMYVLSYLWSFLVLEPAAQPSATSICHLPPEVMLKIFSYLNPQELCRCSQVNSKWAQLAKAGSLWKHLYPVLWARGELHLLIEVLGGFPTLCIWLQMPVLCYMEAEHLHDSYWKIQAYSSRLVCTIYGATVVCVQAQQQIIASKGFFQDLNIDGLTLG